MSFISLFFFFWSFLALAEKKKKKKHLFVKDKWSSKASKKPLKQNHADECNVQINRYFWNRPQPLQTVPPGDKYGFISERCVIDR